MDPHVKASGGRRGHQRFIIFGLQTYAGNQAAKGAIHERVGKLIYQFSQMLKFQRVGKDTVHIPLIPPDRLAIRRQNHILLSSTLEPFTFGPPAFQSDFCRAGCRALDIDMNHRTIRINPEANETFLTGNGGVNGDASGLKIQLLPELNPLLKKRFF
jgi:hypothetical protein